MNKLVAVFSAFLWIAVPNFAQQPVVTAGQNTPNTFTSPNQVVGPFNFYLDTGTANAFVISTGCGPSNPSCPNVLTSLQAGAMFSIKAKNTSTGASTLAVDNVGAISITGFGSVTAGNIFTVQFDGTSFQLIGNGTSGGGSGGPSPAKMNSFLAASCSPFSGQDYILVGCPNGPQIGTASNPGPFGIAECPTSSACSAATPSGNSGDLQAKSGSSFGASHINDSGSALTASEPLTLNSQGSSGNAALKNISTDPVRYVSANGNDTNDGLSWGTAKATVYAAYNALPSGGGTIDIAGSVSVGNPLSANDGLYIMGSNDPQWNSGATITGWLAVKSVDFICAVPNSNTAFENTPQCRESWGNQSNVTQPSLWLSGFNTSLHFKNITFLNAGRAANVGVESTGTIASGGGVQAVTFDDCAFTIHQASTSGPGVLIGDNTFWVFFNRPFFQGNSADASSSTVDAAYGLVIDPVGGSGLIFINHAIASGGGIRAYQGNSAGTGLYIDGYQTENALQAMVDFPSGGVTLARIKDLEIADCGTFACNGVEVDGGNTAVQNNIVVENIFAPLVGPMQVVGGGLPFSGPASYASLPEVTGQYGDFAGHLNGVQVDAARRDFGPAAAYSNNLVNFNKFTAFCSSCTQTTGITAPDGTTDAFEMSTTAGGQQVVSFYQADAQSVSVGDYYIYGVWAKSVSGNDFNTGNPVTFTLLSDGYGTGDTCLSSGINSISSLTYAQSGWSFYRGICKISAAPVQAGPLLKANIDSTHPAAYYGEVLYYFPVGSIGDNDAWEIYQNLAGIRTGCLQGQICGSNGQTLVEDSFQTEAALNAFPNTPACLAATTCGSYVAPSPTVSDSFVRKNATSLGNNWNLNVGNFSIASNVAINTSTSGSDGIASWGQQYFSNDQWAQVTIGTAPTTGTTLAGAVVRAAGPGVDTFYLYECVSAAGANNRYLVKDVAGTGTTLLTGPTATCSSGDVLRLEVVGNQLTGFYNGTVDLQATDSSIASGSPGMRILNSGGTGVGVSISAFTGGNMEGNQIASIFNRPNTWVQPQKFSQIGTAANCLAAGSSASASAVACGSAAAGMFSVPITTPTSAVVTTTALTPNSEIFIQQRLDTTNGAGAALSVTCNTNANIPTITARGTTTFTISFSAFSSNPGCYEYHIIN